MTVDMAKDRIISYQIALEGVRSKSTKKCYYQSF